MTSDCTRSNQNGGLTRLNAHSVIMTPDSKHAIYNVLCYNLSHASQLTESYSITAESLANCTIHKQNLSTGGLG